MKIEEENIKSTGFNLEYVPASRTVVISFVDLDHEGTKTITLLPKEVNELRDYINKNIPTT